MVLALPISKMLGLASTEPPGVILVGERILLSLRYTVTIAWYSSYGV